MKSDCSLPLWVLFMRSLSAVWVSECSLISCWSHPEVILSHPEVILKSSWSLHEVILKSSWSLHEVILKSSWSLHEVILKSSWRIWAQKMKIESFRQVWTKRTHIVTFIELVSEPKMKHEQWKDSSLDKRIILLSRQLTWHDSKRRKLSTWSLVISLRYIF